MAELVTDLSVLWDPAASRHARVLVSDGRLEIVLDGVDHDWVAQALTSVAVRSPVIVIACPE